MISSSKPIQSQQRNNRRHMTQVKEILKPGTIYEAIVESVNVPSNTCQVRLKQEKLTIDGCVWASGIISGLLGFKTSYLPPPKTSVLIVSLGYQPYYIIGCVPQSTNDAHSSTRPALDSSNDYRNAVKFAPQTKTSSPSYGGHKPPIDLMEGEIQIDNMLGVGLQLLRGLGRITAGQLASVECHLVNDMVRIVSDTFKHHTAFGDYTINNDNGKLTVQWHGTAYDHEAWGLQNANQPKAKLSGENRIQDSADGYVDNGRWRFSQYIGFLGDFINMWVSDPQEQVGKLAEGQFRSGKARLNVANDGTILMQSVSEIALEKVVRIPVPIQINPVGAAGVAGNTLAGTLPSDPLKDWVPSDASNIFECVFQLREYTRWLANQYTVGRFKQLPGRYQVPSEAQTPEPERYSDEVDREAANPSVPTNYRLAYAAFRIFKDGSIQHIDAYGNSMTTTATGVMLSAVGDLRLEATGSIYMSAGGSINILSKLGINISSITSSIRIKCHQFMELFSGSILSATATTLMQLISRSGQAVIQSDETTITGAVEVTGDFSASHAGMGVSGGVLSMVGTVSAAQVETLVSVFNGEGPHPGHMLQGFSDVSFKLGVTPITTLASLDEVISDEVAAAGGQAYESPTQQFLRAEGSQFELWDVSNLTLGGVAIPWNSTNKVFLSTAQLNKPSSATSFKDGPSVPMVSLPTALYTQQ